LFLTQANLPALREKLADPIYTEDMATLVSDADAGNPLANAFLYQLTGDSARGQRAKELLLSDSFGDVPGLDKVGARVEPVLVFDWLMPILSDPEKAQAFEIVRARQEFDHRTEPVPDEVEWYWNDTWSRHVRLHYPLLALAVAGDGIDDVWAEEVLELAYSESTQVLSPYGASHGSGALDVLMTMSLDDGGGEQAGASGELGGNYYSFFLHSFLLLGGWETATGQSMWARCNFFRKQPHYWVYDKKNKPSWGLALPTLEFITGVYRDIDPEAAALARWLVDKWGRGRYSLVYRLILGDLRVAPKSPQELGLPTAKYIRGADLFVSSRSWDDNALTVTAYARYLDTSRYEPESGVFAIHRGFEPLAVPSEPGKERPSAGFYSGIWIYDPTNLKETWFHGSTYWSRLNNYETRTHRAKAGFEPVNDPNFFPGGPDRIEINDRYRAISVEYGKLFKAPGVQTARRTIVHLLDEGRDFVVVYDYTRVPPHLKQAWSMRLATTPQISGAGFSIPGMQATVLAPTSHTITWVGGLGDELKSPPPERLWYGNNRGGNTSGYSADPDRAKRYGIGNLFVQPVNGPEQLEYLVVIEVTDGTKTAITRVSDREARFGKWRVSFGNDGSYSVE
jgi:hypothetical protein